MLENRSLAGPIFKIELTKRWLSWLAKGMIKHQQTIFLIERLQPSWLSTGVQLWVYTILSRLFGGFSIGMVIWLSANLILRMFSEVIPIFYDEKLILFSLSMLFLIEVLLALADLGLILGIVGGLTVGTLDALRFASAKFIGARKKSNNSNYLQLLINFLLIFLIVGLITSFLGLFNEQPREDEIRSLMDTFANELPDGFTMPNYSVLIGAFVGLLNGLIFALLFGTRQINQNITNDIRSIDAISFSWSDARKGALFGLILGPIIGFILSLIIFTPIRSGYEVVYQFFYYQDKFDMYPVIKEVGGVMWIFLGCIGMLLGLLGVPIGAMFTGLRKVVLGTASSPNQGVRLAFKNACITGFLFSLPGLLLFGLIILISFSGAFLGGTLLGFIFVIGLCLGIVAFLWYGGLDLIQHYTLRLILYLNEYTPWNYSRFLDYCSERMLVQKVGGGYSFIHRTLMEHFAEMDS